MTADQAQSTWEQKSIDAPFSHALESETARSSKYSVAQLPHYPNSHALRQQEAVVYRRRRAAALNLLIEHQTSMATGRHVAKQMTRSIATYCAARSAEDIFLDWHFSSAKSDGPEASEEDCDISDRAFWETPEKQSEMLPLILHTTRFFVFGPNCLMSKNIFSISALQVQSASARFALRFSQSLSTTVCWSRSCANQQHCSRAGSIQVLAEHKRGTFGSTTHSQGWGKDRTLCASFWRITVALQLCPVTVSHLPLA